MWLLSCPWQSVKTGTKSRQTCLVLMIHTAVIIIFLSENSPQIPLFQKSYVFVLTYMNNFNSIQKNSKYVKYKVL